MIEEKNELANSCQRCKKRKECPYEFNIKFCPLQCQLCQDYRKCSYGEGHFYEVDTEAGKQYVSWYIFSDIRWCPYQVIFIILNSEILEAGNWPSNPKGSGYTDPMIRTGFRDEAYFTKPEEILGEVEYRRRRTGTDGKLLRAEVLAGLDLSDESRSALMYIKGWRRKRMSFSAWKKWRKLYQKVK